MFISAFEQFALIGSMWFNLKQFILPFFSLISVFYLINRFYNVNQKLVITNWVYMLKDQYMMVLDMINSVGKGYIKWLFSLYILILLLNLIGLLPFSYALTSQLGVTLTFGLGMWLGKLKIGINQKGIKLLNHFLPVGLPLLLGPFFVLIEIIGFCIPLISISVRLFANILSGHVLVHVLLGFIWQGILMNYGFFIIIPGSILLGLILLEWSVGFIQAYVFTLLIGVYLSEVDS